MSVKSKIIGTGILAAVLFGAYTVSVGHGNAVILDPENADRTATLIGNWGTGTAQPGGAMIHSNLLPGGQKYIPVPNKHWANGVYNESFKVPAGTVITLTVAADNVVASYCQIRGPGIPARPPATSPAGVVSSTVNCTATVK